MTSLCIFGYKVITLMILMAVVFAIMSQLYCMLRLCGQILRSQASHGTFRVVSNSMILDIL